MWKIWFQFFATLFEQWLNHSKLLTYLLIQNTVNSNIVNRSTVFGEGVPSKRRQTITATSQNGDSQNGDRMIRPKRRQRKRRQFMNRPTLFALRQPIVTWVRLISRRWIRFCKGRRRCYVTARSFPYAHYTHTRTLLNSRIKRAWKKCMTTCINDTVIKQC